MATWYIPNNLANAYVKIPPTNKIKMAKFAANTSTQVSNPLKNNQFETRSFFYQQYCTIHVFIRL